MARDKAERPDNPQGGQPHTPHTPQGALTSPPVSLSVAELRQLITLMNGSDIEEIAIEEQSGSLRLALRKAAPVALPAAGGGSIEESLEALLVDEAPDEGASGDVEVRSPLVGVFRVGMKPGAKALATIGDVVREGQVVCAVEALNVPNEVEAPIAGRLSAVFVSEGQAVEYGQPLLTIEPLS